MLRSHPHRNELFSSQYAVVVGIETLEAFGSFVGGRLIGEEFVAIQLAVPVFVLSCEQRCSILLRSGGCRRLWFGIELRFRFRVFRKGRAKVSDDRGLIGGKVFSFQRVRLVIVKFKFCSICPGTRLFPFNEPVSGSTNGAAQLLATRVNVDDRVLRRRLWISQNLGKTAAVQ